MRAAKRKRRSAREMRTGFVRGFVATGLLAAVQDRSARKRGSRRMLRVALQGGIALAAGGTAADALQRRDWTVALASVAVGGAGLLAIEKLLQDENDKEKTDGQEEA